MAMIARPPCDEGIVRHGRAALRACADRSTASWVLAAAVLGSSMAFIDGTVVNVALPAIQRDFGIGVGDAQWVVESYSLLLAALVLVGGALGDRLGRRRVFTAGVALFAVTSAVCAAAPSITVLIVARAVQGVAAALLTPGSLAMISAAYDGEARGKAIGTWSASTAVTAAIGPVLGGFLVGQLSWRWAFIINLPLAAVVLVILRLRVPESRDESVTGGIDWPGSVLATAGLGLLVFGLIQSQTDGLGSAAVIGSLAGGAVALVAFVVLEAAEERPGSRRAPMMPLALFASRVFSATNGLTLLLYAALGGALFFLPLTLIEVHGYSPQAAGAALLPLILILSLLSRWAGTLVPRVGARLPLSVGPLITAGGYLLLLIPGTGGSYWTTWLPAAVVLGLGMAVTVAPLTTTVMGAVPQTHAGIASGINNAVARAAGLIAIAVFGVILVGRFNSTLDSRLDSRHLPAAAVSAVDAQRSSLALAQPPAGLSASDTAGVRDDIASSFVSGDRLVFLIGAALCVAAAAIAFVGLREQPRRARAPSPLPASAAGG